MDMEPAPVNTSRSSQRALVLTSTLRPASSVYGLKRADWDLREHDYLASAERWGDAHYPVWDEMLLVDNSPVMSDGDWAAFGTTLQRRSSGLIEPVRAPGPAEHQAGTVQKGKGEAQLLDSAVAELAGRGITYFAKVTGRLFVTNIAEIFKVDTFDGISGALSSRLDMSDTRFFGMPVDTWVNHYRGIADEVDETEGVLFEHVFTRRTLAAVASGVPFYGVRRIPRFIGSSGSMDIDYGSTRRRVNQALHELARVPFRRRSTGLML